MNPHGARFPPPHLTIPIGPYICVVDIDRGTGEVKTRRFVAVDDCGNIIDPMITVWSVSHGLPRLFGDQHRRINSIDPRNGPAPSIAATLLLLQRDS